MTKLRLSLLKHINSCLGTCQRMRDSTRTVYTMSTTRYTKIGDTSNVADSLEKAEPLLDRVILKETRSGLVKILIAFFAGVLCAAFSLALIKNLHTSRTYEILLEPAGSIVTPFEYDETYPGPPTPASEQAWLDLLPEGLGFVQREDLGPGIVDFSVFHQLHCLMALRHSIYDSWNETRHTHVTPHHTKHCLEYIRQSIMCNGDTNVENRQTFEDGRKFTPGWGFKTCRDYEALKNFAEEWRVWNGKTPSTKRPVHDPDVLKGRTIHY